MASQRCTELEKMVAAVGSFRGFLGPQFVSVSGEAQARCEPAATHNIVLGWSWVELSAPYEATEVEHPALVSLSGTEAGWQRQDSLRSAVVQGVERLLGRVDELAACVQRVTFDIFDKAHAAEWRNTKAGFDARNQVVSNVTKELINTSFRCCSNHLPSLHAQEVPCTGSCPFADIFSFLYRPCS